MSPKKSPTRVRRSFTSEFKRDAVRLIEKGKSVIEVTRPRHRPQSPPVLEAAARRRRRRGPGARDRGRLRGRSSSEAREGAARCARRTRHSEKSAGLLRGRPELKFRFVQEYRETFWVGSMCRVLEVFRSGYYAWRRRQPSLRDRENERLTEILSRRLCEKPAEYHEMSHQQ